MVASAWKVFWTAKKRMGLTGFNLATGSGFRMSLHKTAASANLLSSNVSTYGSIGSGAGGVGGISTDGQALGLATWTLSGSTYTFDTSNEIYSPSGAAMTSVRYAVIRLSVAAASGYPLCYAALSTIAFDVGDGSSLTVQMAATGKNILPLRRETGVENFVNSGELSNETILSQAA